MTGKPAGIVRPTAEPILPDGFLLVALDKAGSTNDEAKRLAVADAPHGTIVWAREQTAGRGRQLRQWVSPRGNLFVSFILRPSRPSTEVVNLGFVAALAVADYIRDVCPAALVSLKWPNDVLIGEIGSSDSPLLQPPPPREGGREKEAQAKDSAASSQQGAKVSGILLESSISHPGIVDWVVLGIGINLITAPTDTPYKATSLAEFVEPPSAEQALIGLTWALDRWLTIWDAEGFRPIRTAWLEIGTRPGTAITVKEEGGVSQGTFIDLDLDGALVFETARATRRIAAGDVYFRL